MLSTQTVPSHVAAVNGRPLRGRSDEIDRAVGVLSTTKAWGQGSVILVTGEPGIGKTALLTAIADHGRQMGFATGVGKAEEVDQIAPMAPLLVALRAGPSPLLSRDDFNELAPLYHQQLWLVDRLTSMLERRSTRSPLLIAIDDLQWVDQLSAFALRVMPVHLTGSPIVWLLAARPRPAQPANEIIGAVAGNVPVVQINLAPLKPAAIDELALDRHGERPAGRLRDLLQGADGYPFLAVELLDGYLRDANASPAVERERGTLGPTAASGGELPHRLVLGVRNRLEQLSAETLRVVQVASILGRSFTVEDLTELLRAASWSSIIPALDAAVRAGVVEDRGERIVFRHDLFRQAVYEDVPQSMRIALHRAAAECMLAAGRGALEAAPHVLVCANRGDDRAVKILRDAAAAVISTMPAVAAELVERAFSLLDRDDPAWSGTGLEAIATVTAAGRGKDALVIADRMLATRVSDETAAEIQARVARTLWEMGRVDEMRARVREAAALGGVSIGLRAELLALQALALSCEPDWSATFSGGQTALNEARRVGNARAEADALRALGEASRNDGRHDRALGYFRALRKLGAGTSPADELISLQLLDRYDDSAALLARARVESEDRCDISKSPALAFAQMWQNYSLGLLEDAEVDASTLVQMCDDWQEHTHQDEARIMLGRIAQLRGDFSAARARLAAVARDTGSPGASRTLMMLLVTAWLAESEGNIAAALETVRRLVRPARDARHRWLLQPAWLVAATRISIAGGDTELAREVMVRAQLLAERNAHVVTMAGIGAHVAGLVHREVGSLSRAVEILRGSPRLLVRADALADLGSMQLAAGRRREGVAALESAWTIFNERGAHGESRKVQRLLQTAGIRRRHVPTVSRPLEGWAALTETEQRVARLIADGHTNRSAAAELVLSPNTVATHLRSIFGKLSVTSRSQLTRVVISQHG